MLREESIEDIYDGRFYAPDDLVPVGCEDCAGCSDCCETTGDSIILDPFDMYMLSRGTGKTFADMLEREIEIRLVDGLILPNLMQHHEVRAGEQPAPGAGELPGSLAAARTDPGVHPGVQPAPRAGEQPRCAAAVSSGSADRQGSAPGGCPGDRCPFLSALGRCTIHPYRPGMCRLYPLGRYYADGGFRYILQKNECTGRVKTPVLLRDWLDIDDLPRYEAFVLDWHRFREAAQRGVRALTDHSRESVLRYILQVFFMHPYLPGMDFYPQYGARMEVCREALGRIL